MPPTVDVEDAQAVERPSTQEQKGLLKAAVQDRYFALVEGGVSPNSAAVDAIREIGSGSQASQSPQKTRASAATGETASRQLRFESPEGDTTASLQRSISAPGLTATLKPPDASTSSAGGMDSNGHHRNRDVWKTFGIHLPAGRSLKRLYGGGFDGPVPGSMKGSSKHNGPPTELDTYIAVNNLQAGTVGLRYRKSMSIFDVCGGEHEVVRWGDAVEGHRVDACWLKVGDRYLPTIVNKVQMLKRFRGPEVLRAAGLKRQQCLPPLKKGPPTRSSPQLLVGGVSY